MRLPHKQQKLSHLDMQSDANNKFYEKPNRHRHQNQMGGKYYQSPKKVSKKCSPPTEYQSPVHQSSNFQQYPAMNGNLRAHSNKKFYNPVSTEPKAIQVFKDYQCHYNDDGLDVSQVRIKRLFLIQLKLFGGIKR